MRGILGKKIGMTAVYDEEGVRIPVTVIKAGPCVVTDIRTEKKNGYNAIQVGYESIHKNRLTRPEKGQFDRFKLKPLRYLKEISVETPDEFKEGQEIKVDIFKVGERVDVIGTSVGKGFAGAMKRWNFNGGGASHGSKVHRRPCSAGSTDPARSFKGKRGPGQMGNTSSTILNLEVVRIDTEKDMLLVRGAVPGSKNSLVMVRETVKISKGKKYKIRGTVRGEVKSTRAKGKKTIKKKI